MVTHIAFLPDRGVVSVTGADARKYLSGIITNDIKLLDKAPAIHTGLLTAQGKILWDFFVVTDGDGLLLDIARDQAPGLIERLNKFKLRSKVDIVDVSADYTVAALWGDNPTLESGPGVVAYTDPRLADMGTRVLIKLPVPAALGGAEAVAATDQDYHAHRVALGVPEGGKDYVYGDTFPHEALFDQLHGVSFTKGCFVGQEVVARMKYRTTVRKRVLPVAASAELPAGGVDVLAGEVSIGSLGSVSANTGLAMVRIDRVQDFKSKGVPFTAGGVAIEVKLPAFADFSLEASS